MSGEVRCGLGGSGAWLPLRRSLGAGEGGGGGFLGSTGKLRHGAGGVRSGSGGAAAFCGVRSLRCGALRVRCGAEPLCGETEARGCAAPPGMGGVRAPAAPRGGGSPWRGSASEALRFAWFGAVVFSPVWSALWGSRYRHGRIRAQPRTALPAGRPSDGRGMLLSGSLRSRNARGSVYHPPSPHRAVIPSIPSLIPAAAPRWDAHPLSVRCSAFLSGAHKLQRFVRIAPWLSCRHCAARSGGSGWGEASHRCQVLQGSGHLLLGSAGCAELQRVPSRSSPSHRCILEASIWRCSPGYTRACL